MHERLAVYVPNPDAPPHVARQVKAIAPGSGIVGRILQERDPDESPVLIYFEGNVYGSGNIITFADRVYHAASRMTHDAPTIAMRAVQADALVQVGWFYPQHQRVEVEDGGSLTRVAKWLGLYDGDEDLMPHGSIDTDRLAVELIETRATPANYRGQRVHVTPQDRERLAGELEDA